jgi:biopolymer transport protein ExbD
MAFSQRETRSLIRKAIKRVPEGEEIRHLNIMPMMDMMTILLVAFIFQMAVSATEATANQVSLPKTASDDELPEKSGTLIITRNGIVFVDSKGAKSLVTITNGHVDCGEKEGGCQGVKIPKLVSFLQTFHNAELDNERNKPGYDPNNVPPAELMIIADRVTPYQVLIEVMYSAKQKEAGYKHFRLIVQKSFPPGGGAKK